MSHRQGVVDARPSSSAGPRPAEASRHRRAGRVRWRGRVPRPRPGTMSGPAPCPCTCPWCRPTSGAGASVLALGAGPTSGSVPRPCPWRWPHVRAGAASLLLAPAHVRAGAASLLLAPPGHPDPASADRSVLRSTDLSPAYLRRRLQAVLCHIAATPVTLTTRQPIVSTVISTPACPTPRYAA